MDLEILKVFPNPDDPWILWYQRAWCLVQHCLLTPHFATRLVEPPAELRQDARGLHSTREDEHEERGYPQRPHGFRSLSPLLQRRCRGALCHVKL